MDYKNIILEKYLKGIPANIQFIDDKKARPYLHGALEEYGRTMVSKALEMNNKPRRRFALMAFGHFGKLTWHEMIMFLRTKSLKRYKRIAQKLSNENNRKYYVVRSSELGYKLFSSLDVKVNKKLRIFGNDVSVLKLHETADAVVYPK